MVRPDDKNALQAGFRKYGEGPYDIAVIHGGPGAPGYMAPVARELCSRLERGVLEPLQTELSMEGVVSELKRTLELNADLPVILVGSSWGAMLSYIIAARFPELVEKVVMVGSAVFDHEYSKYIKSTRLNRMNDSDRKKAQEMIRSLENPDIENRDILLSRLGFLYNKADTYKASTMKVEIIETSYRANKNVWRDAEALRESGELLEIGHHIQCPVVAIHGDYDPHPYQGVEKPLSSVLKDFHFILLEKCGHLPWNERLAAEVFYRHLQEALGG